MKNKHAQTAFYAIMLAMVLIVLVLAMIPVGKKFNDDAMNTTWNESVSFENSTGGIEVGNITHIGLDCENPDLNMFQHGTCIITDFGFAYFFGGLLLIALGILGARIYFGGSS
jgi:hypothetical protein